MSRTLVEVGRKKVPLTHLKKNLYPSYGFTKENILEYYRGISPFILPHLKGRALTFKRYPEGAESGFFFEKRCPDHRPPWVQTAEIPLAEGGRMTVCLVNDLETLMWAENLASIELHVPLARATSYEIADAMVFDLDPGEPATILECARVALVLRDLLSQMGLSSYPKTSGKKGLHIYVPLNRKETTFDDTKRFSKAVAAIMQKHYPDLVTAKMDKRYRPAKVFINWSQNDASKTMVSIYSLRAGQKPVVSFPLEWKELEHLGGRSDPEKIQVMAPEAVSRAEKKGDLFGEVLTKEQKLPHL